MRLTTWNILHGRGLDDGRVDAPRLERAVASLDADVIALQEVDRGQARSGGLDLTAVVADAVGAAHARFVPTVIGSPGFEWCPATDADEDVATDAYGIALVSRFPVVSWHVRRLAPVPTARMPLAVPGERDVMWLRDEPRVALAAQLSTPAGPLTVASTHLSFVPGVNVAQLRDAAAWLRGLPGPAFLMGDLNLPRALVGGASGLRVLAQAATYPAPRPRVQLDHILGSGDVPGVRGAGARALPVSDHLALSVDLADPAAARRGPARGSGDDEAGPPPGW